MVAGMTFSTTKGSTFFGVSFGLGGSDGAVVLSFLAKIESTED